MASDSQRNLDGEFSTDWRHTDLTKEKTKPVLTLKDAYREKHSQPIKTLMNRINEHKQRTLPFLCRLKLDACLKVLN